MASNKLSGNLAQMALEWEAEELKKRAAPRLEKAIKKSIQDFPDDQGKCHKHRNYQGIKQPRVSCHACWFIFFEKRGREYFGW